MQIQPLITGGIDEVAATCQALRSQILRSCRYVANWNNTSSMNLFPPARIDRIRVVVGCVVLFLGLMSAAWLVSGLLSPAETITKESDESALGDAVGLVVCGARVTGPSGNHWEVQFSTGSCFAVSRDGYLITNKHVVEDLWNKLHAEHIWRKLRDEQFIDVKPTVWVFFGKKSKYKANIVELNDDFDLAILKIDRIKVPFFSLSASGRLPRGAKVTTCGFPAASQIPISEGEQLVVRFREQSSKRNKIEAFFKPRDFDFVMTTGSISRVVSEDSEEKTTWVQHDASINPGSSGGPLLDENRTVVGINTQSITSANATYYSLAISPLRIPIENFVKGMVWK